MCYLPPSDMQPLDLLRDILNARAPAGARAWLAAMESAGRDRGALFGAFAAAGRKLGASRVELAPAEAEAARHLGIEAILARASLDELGRAALLSMACAAAPEGAVDVVAEAYRQGDDREKRAVVRALPLLPDPARFVDVAVNACRTSVDPVFEGIAADNPYPSAHFPDLAFRQMVLKALFVGVPLERVIGLSERTTPELERMAHDYASERRAAGRAVPADIERFFGGAR